MVDGSLASWGPGSGASCRSLGEVQRKPGLSCSSGNFPAQLHVTTSDQAGVRPPSSSCRRNFSRQKVNECQTGRPACICRFS